jgi:ABC-2 type transport system permease protein
MWGSWAILRHQLRLLRSDLEWAVLLVGLPLIVLPFAMPLYRNALDPSGTVGGQGAAQAIPGLTLLFAGFIASLVGIQLFQEHGWGTWDRVRRTLSPRAVIVGFAAPVLMLGLGQFVVLLTAGYYLFGLESTGSIPALAVVAIAVVTVNGAFGIALAAVCRTYQQLSSIANVAAFVFAGFGGALVPSALLPQWVRSVAVITPTRWSMKAFESVLSGEGWRTTALNVSVLAAFIALFAGAAIARFRLSDHKHALHS